MAVGALEAKVLSLLDARAYQPPGADTLYAAFRALDKVNTGSVEVDKLRRALTDPARPGALSAEGFAEMLKLLPRVPVDTEAGGDEDAPARVRYTDYVTLAGRR